jgi:hypothetical protein
MKAQLHGLLSIAAVVAISGCNTAPLTTTKQPMTLDFALERVRFEMPCPKETGSVPPSETIQPPNVGLRFSGPQRAQFTIGVADCGKRETLVVICADGSDGCFADEEDRDNAPDWI